LAQLSCIRLILYVFKRIAFFAVACKIINAFSIIWLAATSWNELFIVSTENVSTTVATVTRKIDIILKVEYVSLKLLTAIKSDEFISGNRDTHK